MTPDFRAHLADANLSALVLFSALGLCIACGSEDAAAGVPDKGMGGEPICGDEPLTWQACGATPAECATLRVPLDRNEPSGQTIGLEVVRLRVVDEEKRKGVLIVRPGGVGTAAVDWPVLRTPTVLGELALAYDVVSWNVRGGSADTRVECGHFQEIRTIDPTPDDEAEWQALDEYWRNFAESCTARHPADWLAQLSTRQDAEDMACLLEALGEEKTSYLGLSHATLLGASFASLFPRRAHAIVLDAAVAPAADFPSYWAARAHAVEGGFRELIEQCSADTTCAFHGGESVDAISAAYVDLAKTMDGSASNTIGEWDLHMAAYAAAVSREGTALWSACAKSERGDHSELLALADAAWPGNPDGRAFALWPNDFRCPAGFSQQDARALIAGVASESPLLAPALMTSALSCLHWPVHADSLSIGETRAPPALVVGGSRDVLAPAQNVEQIVDALANGSYPLVHNLAGHTAFFNFENPCIRETETAFLLEPTHPPSNAPCP